jgi:pilus assembly protein CpaF
MVLMAGLDLPARSIREQVASAVDLVVHLNRMPDGSRRVTAIAEVVGLQGEVVELATLFAFDHRAGRSGALVPTGVKPRFAADVDHLGDPLARAFPEWPREVDPDEVGPLGTEPR